MSSKFRNICSETGIVINKGDDILYDTNTKKAFCKQSQRYTSETESACVASHIEANENADYDNFCRQNNI